MQLTLKIGILQFNILTFSLKNDYLISDSSIGGDTMIQALVKEFRNNETLQAELNAFLSRWHQKHGEMLTIISVTAHAPETLRNPQEGYGSMLSPHHVKYTFFYKGSRVLDE